MLEITSDFKMKAFSAEKDGLLFYFFYEKLCKTQTESEIGDFLIVATWQCDLLHYVLFLGLN